MKVVCQIYRGQLSADCTLEQLEPFATNFYSHRPRMIRFRLNGITLLIFTSFRFRLMGRGDQHLAVLHSFLKKLPWQLKVSNLHLSTSTVVHDLGHSVNLYSLESDHFFVELEIFPAAIFRHGGKEHINVFHTGRLVITGVQNFDKINYPV